MTIWIVFQDTDFCSSKWEERIYNGIVGVIYCFTFFNLKEGKSRYRAGIFYSITIVENYVFLFLFNWLWIEDPAKNEKYTVAAICFVTIGKIFTILLLHLKLTDKNCYVGTTIGLSCMMIYYRFFHPAGPIRPCVGQSVDFKNDLSDFNVKPADKTTPDFVIEFEDANQSTSTKNATIEQQSASKRRGIQHSRSFKNTCPKPMRYLQPAPSPVLPPRSSHHSSPGSGYNDLPKGHQVPDSAYGTDSNRTVSRSTSSPPHALHSTAVIHEVPVDCGGLLEHSPNHSSGSSSMAFQNDTYMSFDNQDQGEDKSLSPIGHNNTYQSVRSPSEETVIYRPTAIKAKHKPAEKLLKRSPIVKDVTTGFAQISQTDQMVGKSQKRENLNPPLTILIPNISHHAFARNSANLLKPEHRRESSEQLSDKTIPLEVLNPHINDESLTVNPSTSFHDYENLALININRNNVGGVRHWKTYSDMDDEVHDESVSCDRSKKQRSFADYSSIHYFDIYPLSKEIKDQIYRSITPISTAATMASDSGTNFNSDNTSDTYEPIETYALDGHNKNDSVVPVPVTLIHHDGKQVSTRQIVSMESLKEVLQNHERVKLDDPQERGDLYLLAPMRLLTPILEEPEPEKPAEDFNRSVMTVISEMLTTHNRNMQIYQSLSEKQSVTVHNESQLDSSLHPDGRFPDSVESASSTLVHTIDEIRNQSMCNLYHYSSCADLSPPNGAGPQVPPPNKSVVHRKILDSNFKAIQEEPSIDRKSILNSSVKSIQSNTLVPSPKKVEEPPKKKSPLYSYVGTRKNLLELTEGTGDILNTPSRKEPAKRRKSRDLLGQQTIFDADIKATQSSDSESDGENKQPPKAPEMNLSALSLSHNMALSPSSKYNTPTPPLRPNQFIRNNPANRPRRKFSVMRERFMQPEVKPKQMITARRANDLYENISDEYLELRNSVRQKKTNRENSIKKAKSVPSIVDDQSNIKADQQYDVPPLRQRNDWTSGSFSSHPYTITQSGPYYNRNSNYRRSMSILECDYNDKENAPMRQPPPTVTDLPEKPMHLRLKALNPNVSPYDVPRKVMNTSRLCNYRSSLSPNSKIFSKSTIRK